MYSSDWYSSDQVLPEDGREVITYAQSRWGLRKGYYSCGKWYDVFHRPIEVQYWQPERGDETGLARASWLRQNKTGQRVRKLSRLQYNQARGMIQRVIDKTGN